MVGADSSGRETYASVVLAEHEEAPSQHNLYTF